MAGHFGALGFPVSTREEVEALGVLAANVGEPHEAGDLLYLRWAAGAGVELWAQAEREGKRIKGVTPYFASGKAVVEGTVQEVLPSKRPHDGAISFVPKGTGAAVPIALPDFALVRLAPGARARLSVAAFAHAFEELPSATGAPFALLPAGSGLSLGVGRVLEAEVRTNASSRRPFGWVLLEVEGGTVDLLLDPELREDLPGKDQVCRGVFWLGGRLVSRS